MNLERSPDGSVAMFPAVVGFEVKTPSDIAIILDGLHKPAIMFKERHDFVGYPVFVLEGGGD